MVCEGCVQWCPGGAAGCGCSPSVAGDSSQQIGRTMVCNGAKLSPPKPSLHHHIRYHFTYILIVTSLRLVFFTTWIVQSSLVTSEGGSFLFGQFLKHCIGSKISTSVLFRALNVLLSVPLHVHHQNICFKISTSALIYIIGKYSWTFVIIFYFQTLVTLVYYRGSGYRKINMFHKTFSCPRNLRFVKILS